MEVFVVIGVIEGEPRPVIFIFKEESEALKSAKWMKDVGYYSHVYYRKEEVLM